MFCYILILFFNYTVKVTIKNDDIFYYHKKLQRGQFSTSINLSEANFLRDQFSRRSIFPNLQFTGYSFWLLLLPSQILE